MKNINIIPCESQLINPVLIRMNCLALAVSDETHASPLITAQLYYDWVIKGEGGVKVVKTGTKECAEMLKDD